MFMFIFPKSSPSESIRLFIGIDSSINYKREGASTIGHLKDHRATINQNKTFFNSCPTIFEMPLYLIFNRMFDSWNLFHILVICLVGKILGYKLSTDKWLFLSDILIGLVERLYFKMLKEGIFWKISII